MDTYVLMCSNEMRSGMKSHSTFIGVPAMVTKQSKELVNFFPCKCTNRLGFRKGFKKICEVHFSWELQLGSHSEH